MNNNFKTSDYFDISEFPFNDLFENIENVWEVLPKLIPYITSVFSLKKLSRNYNGKDEIYIGKGTVIEPGVYISGSAVIGENCVLGHGSLIRNGCIIGNNSRIGHAAELKHSIILNNSSLAHLNYAGDSVIGSGVNIAGGAILANYRLDKKSVTVKENGENIDTGLKKFGAIIGDNSNIGVNAVLNPGTILGKNTTVFPLRNVLGIHKNNEVIK